MQPACQPPAAFATWVGALPWIWIGCEHAGLGFGLFSGSPTLDLVCISGVLWFSQGCLIWIWIAFGFLGLDLDLFLDRIGLAIQRSSLLCCQHILVEQLRARLRLKSLK